MSILKAGMVIVLVVGIVLAAIGAATDSIIPLIVGDVLLVVGIGAVSGWPAYRPGGRLIPQTCPVEPGPPFR